MVLTTDVRAHKILGMQLMVETLALTLFQTIRQAAPEPVLTELMKYYDHDEARHVALGMQYLPVVMKGMNRAQVSGVILFQMRILGRAMWEMKVIEGDLRVLGIDAREVMERGRTKQMEVLRSTFESLGIPADRGPGVTFFSVVGELLFPTAETRLSYRAGGGGLRRPAR